MPAHHLAQYYVDEYVMAAGIEEDFKGPLFRVSAQGKRPNLLMSEPLDRNTALKMIKRRAKKTGLPMEISNHSFRGTGITEYLKNGGTIEVAAKIAGHESTRTIQLYDPPGG